MRLVSFAAALALLLAGCGDDESTSDDSDGVPQCSDVWVEGEVLPKDYEGCRSGAAVITPTFTECEDVEGRLTTHENRFVALLGASIEALPGGEDTAHVFSC